MEDLIEIDRQISTEIMGWNAPLTIHTEPDGSRTFLAPAYSNDITYSIKVIEKLDNLSFNINRENCAGVRWDLNTYNDPDMKDKVSLNCQESLPLAICKLALKYKRSKGVL